MCLVAPPCALRCRAASAVTASRVNVCAFAPGCPGNIVADETGVATVNIVDKQIKLIGPLSVFARSMVVTSQEDDMGKVRAVLDVRVCMPTLPLGARRSPSPSPPRTPGCLSAATSGGTRAVPDNRECRGCHRVRRNRHRSSVGARPACYLMATMVAPARRVPAN